MAQRRHVHNFSSNYHRPEPSRVVEIFTDGSWSAQSGHGGCSFLFLDGEEWHCRAFALGHMPQGSAASGGRAAQDAEKKGILFALDFVMSNWAATGEVDAVVLRVDSTFTIGDLAWEYWRLGQTWNDPLENEIVEMIRELNGMGITVHMQHVQRASCEGNRLADDHANIARWESEIGHVDYVCFSFA